MKRGMILAAALAGFAPAAAIAQPAPAISADPARKALADELTQLLSGEAMVMAQVRRVLGEALPKGLMADPNVAAIEKQRPGIIKAMIAAMEPTMLRHMQAELPRLWARVSPIYADNLSAADLRAALAFYRSPTGARVIEVMVTETDFEPLFREMAASGTFSVDDASVAATIAFGNSPAGQRLVALTPKVTAVMMSWTNEPSPGLDAALEKAVIEAMGAFPKLQPQP